MQWRTKQFVRDLRLAFFFALVPALEPASAPAQEGSPLPPGVEARVSAEPTSASVGDLIHINIEIRLPKGHHASIPAPGNQLAEFAVHEFHPGPTVAATQSSEAGKGTSRQPEISPDGATNHRARIVVALYRVGTFEFPGLPWILQDSHGKEIRAALPSIKIEIRSVLQGKDEKLKDLKKQAEIQEPFRWVLWFLLGMVLLLLSLLGWWWWQKRKRPAIPQPAYASLDPFSEAAAELRDLLSRGLLEKGFIKQFYVALSDIIKKVLDAGYRIQTAEKTTSEILAGLRHSDGQAPIEEIGRIAAFFGSCDLVKFAKYIPSKTENETAIQQAHQILEVCRKQRPTPPIERAPETVEVS